MRIVWKDSFANEEHRPVKYRGYTIESYDGVTNGWITNIPNDKNIYKTHYCALNAIDKYHGTKVGTRGSSKRKSYGVQVIGQIK